MQVNLRSTQADTFKLITTTKASEVKTGRGVTVSMWGLQKL